MNDATLAGTGAVYVFLRDSRIRTDAELRTISDDDQRNILIVELGNQTGLSGAALQGMSNLDLVTLGLGKEAQPGAGLTSGQISLIRGVLIAGNFRTQHELNNMSGEDQRNTLIVEMVGHSNQSIGSYASRAAKGRGCVKTQNRIDFRGALTIPRTKQIEYRAFYEVVSI